MSSILNASQNDGYINTADDKEEKANDEISPATSTTASSSSMKASTQQILSQLKLPSLSAGIGCDDDSQSEPVTSTREDDNEEEIRHLSSERFVSDCHVPAGEPINPIHPHSGEHEPILSAVTNSATTLVSSNTSRDICTTNGSPPHNIHSAPNYNKRSIFSTDVDSKYGYRQFLNTTAKKRKISTDEQEVVQIDQQCDESEIDEVVNEIASISPKPVDLNPTSANEDVKNDSEEVSITLSKLQEDIDEDEVGDSQTSLPTSIIRQTSEMSRNMDQVSPLTPGGPAVGSYGTVGSMVITNKIRNKESSAQIKHNINAKSIDLPSPDRTTASISTATMRKWKYGENGDVTPHNRFLLKGATQHKFVAPASPTPSYQNPYTEYPIPPPLPTTPPAPKVHIQSFILALAFFACWSPQNLMAPNLTQMADYFNFTPEQRDLYLGANIAFATGVLSLPVSAMLGFLADIVVSRKKLFAYTVMVGGISSICTGYSETYAQLYFARFVCGGCMSGSVPIAFSILGDLFDAKDRNAASSGLTAMMGAGILMGQVFAGTVGDSVGWKRPFQWSGMLSIFLSLMVMQFVNDPVRGGKEKVLQEMIAKGTQYDRKLTFSGFLYAMTKNKTNVILMIQGFVTNIPWGVIFTFLNDYLSQEQGLSVPASTFLVFWFGIGCAVGGVAGGLLGAKAMAIKRSLLPIFMAVTTIAGIFPFLGLLDMELRGHVLLSVFLAFTGGCIASLPSVNVRPCLLNVNPPETRGAAMTAANLLINVARGAGPSIITVSQMFGVSRQESFNFTLIIFWAITGISLFILAKTLPIDQDAMDAELARYAASKFDNVVNNDETSAAFNESASSFISKTLDDIQLDESVGEESVVSITDRMTSFDAAAAQESISFIGDALREIGEELSMMKQSQPKGYNQIEQDASNVWPGYTNNSNRRWDSGPDIDMERGRSDNSQNGGFATTL